MRYETTSIGPDGLEHHQKMLILRDTQVPAALNVTAFCPKQGFTGVSAIVRPELEMSEIVRALDRSELPDDGSLLITSTGLVLSWFDEAMDADSAEGFAAYRKFITDELPAETLRLTEEFSWISLDDTSINYLSTGNVSNRREVIRELPIMGPAIIRQPDLHEAVDSGDWKGLLKGMSITFGTSVKDLQSFLKVEKMAREEWPVDVNAKTAVSNLSQLFGRGNMLENFSRLNSAQFPADIKNAYGVHEFAQLLELNVMRYKIGRQPFERIRKAINADAWADATKRIRSVDTDGQGDYLDRINMAVKASMLVGKIRESAPGLLERLSSTADAIWNDEEVDEAEAVALSDYLSLVDDSGIIHRYRSSHPVLEVIGEHVSLKQVRELSQRWHHLQQPMDNDMYSARAAVEWEPFLGTVPLGKNVRAREICSSDGLTAQGEIERHCVGGYTSNILNTNRNTGTLIFSIEEEVEGEWKILSTAELTGEHSEKIRRDEDPKSDWTVSQHLARANSDPCDKAREAVISLVEAIEHKAPEDLPKYLEALSGNRSSIRRKLNTTVLSVKGNITSPDLAEASLAIHDLVLPRALRSQNWSDWLERVAAHEIENETDRPLHGTDRPLHRAIARLAEKAAGIQEKLEQADLESELETPGM